MRKNQHIPNHFLSNETDTSMVINLELGRMYIDNSEKHPAYFPSHQADGNDPGHFGSSHWRAGIGVGKLADRERGSMYLHSFPRWLNR